MELIDIGCNLTHESFNSDRDSVIERAGEVGVTQIIVTGASAEGSEAALDLARLYPGALFATAGIHPHHADEVTPDTLSLLRELAGQHGIVAVGETGLDYYRDICPRPVQKQAFENQAEIAMETGLPLFLHMRDAHNDFHAIVKEVRDRVSNIVVHCFTGTQHQLHLYLDLDCYIGITGWICDERRGSHLKEFVKDIPPDRLLLETDSPYLIPRDLELPVKTRRNEPQWLPWIASTVAASRGETVEYVAEHTTSNAQQLFRLPME
jgi:TatD DNase family protein